MISLYFQKCYVASSNIFICFKELLCDEESPYCMLFELTTFRLPTATTIRLCCSKMLFNIIIESVDIYKYTHSYINILKEHHKYLRKALFLIGAETKHFDKNNS